MPRVFIIVSTLLVITAACSPSETPTPQPPEGLSTQAAPAATELPGTAPATQPPAQPAASASPAANAAPVTLQVLTPQDGAVVNTQQITVSGAASPGAVVTVNDDILIAGADGQFQDLITLTEGLNLIEVVASNTSGSNSSVELTVMYEP